MDAKSLGACQASYSQLLVLLSTEQNEPTRHWNNEQKKPFAKFFFVGFAIFVVYC